MKVRFETTTQTAPNKKKKMVCLDISENIRTITFEFPLIYTRSIEERIKNAIYSKYRLQHCICREDRCGCWSSRVTMVAIDMANENAIAHIELTQR